MAITIPKLFSYDEIMTSVVFNLKIILVIIIIIFIWASFTAATMSKSDVCNDYCNVENFSNDDFFSTKDALNPGYSTSQTAILTSPTQNLIAGQADRIIYQNLNDSSKYTLYFNVVCNLYVLNGNPLYKSAYVEDKPIPLDYKVYLIDNNGK